jgi:hypothetical protein
MEEPGIKAVGFVRGMHPVHPAQPSAYFQVPGENWEVSVITEIASFEVSVMNVSGTKKRRHVCPDPATSHECIGRSREEKGSHCRPTGLSLPRDLTVSCSGAHENGNAMADGAWRLLKR